jgi:resuscitation-promoting factor RpfB
VVVEHADDVPDRKFTLYRSRLQNRTSTFRLTIALSAPALAVAAIAASGWVAGGTAARPISPTVTTSATLLSTQAVAATASHHLGRNRAIAWRMMGHRSPWRPKYQFRYVNRLWERESSWRVHAFNPYSGAYGIPQAVPGSKMASAGSHWRTSARTQIRWGFRYIRSRYGSPRKAWAHECAYGWY